MAARAASRPAWRADTRPVWRSRAPSANDRSAREPSALLMHQSDLDEEESDDEDDEDDEEEESEDAGFAASFFLSACLASCLSAPSLADRSFSRLRLAVP